MSPVHAPPPRLLVLAFAAALAGCGPSLPRVSGSAGHRETLRQWDRSMSAARAGGGLARTTDELPAQPTPPEPEPIEIPQIVDDPAPYALSLRDAELGQALMLLGEQAGLNVVLDGDFAQPVRITLPAVRLQAALEMLARTYGCTIEARDGIVIVRRDDPSVAQTRVFVLHSTSAAALQPQVAAIVGESGVVVHPERNVVMVTANASRMRDVEAYLAAVDIPDRQVLIEARILEINRNDLLELGSAIARNDIAVDDWTASFVTDLLSPAPSVVASGTHSSGDMDVTLDLLRSLMNLEILQRPRLVALHNRLAKLEILSELPYIEATTTTESTGSLVGAQTVEEVQFKNVGLELSITPSIQADGLVSLLVDQRISVQTGTFNDIPVVDSRTLSTSFVVREGDTIMIGGIMKNSALDQTSGVPLLMDIPWLGRLFRNDANSASSQELVILMTPRLVDPRSLGPESSDHVRVELESLS